MNSTKKKRAYKLKSKHKSLLVTISMLLVIVLLIAFDVSMLLYCFGGVRLTISLNGDRNMTIAHGEQFDDPGCEAVLKGDLLFQNGYHLPVSRSNNLNENKPGVYELTYQVRFGVWSGSVKRQVEVVDMAPPEITLVENPDSYVQPGEEYVEEGYSAYDACDGDLTDRVQVVQETGRVVYSVTDAAGNRTEVVREIVYYDPIPPEITLLGEEEMTLHAGIPYTDPGFEASDNVWGDMTEQVEVTGTVNVHQVGTYTLTYSVDDTYGNVTQRTRTVTVTTEGQPEVVRPEGKVIYLTFDDGPGPYTEKLLDILDKYGVKVTFFVCDTDYVDLIKDIVDRGHAVGIHTASHNYGKIYRSREAYFDDLYKMQGIIEDISGVTTTMVRFPGGSSNEIINFNPLIMTYLAKDLNAKGFQYYDWNVNSGDAGLTKRTARVVEYVIDGVQGQDISIVLQHDIKEYSVDAVEEIILWALDNGYRFLPLDPSSPTSHHRIRN